jgi:parallel beta-helix repeat protein
VSTSASFAFSSNEEDATFECALDGAAFQPCTSPMTLSGLAPGEHTLQVRAVDAEGLADPAPATYTWTVGAAPVATAVTCGQAITASVRLSNGLTDCGGNGLVVGADGITIDLNGHTLDGTGLGAGVLVDGFDSVTVTNGRVQEFDFGVQVTGATSRAVVSGVTAQLNQEAGVALTGAAQATVRDGQVLDNPLGILLGPGTTGSVVAGNTVARTAGDGVRLEGADGNRVEANEVSESSGAGVALAGADGNAVIANTLSENDSGGVTVGEPDLPANDNRVERNRVSGGGGPGVSVTDSSGNDLLANVASGSGSAGISLEGATDTLVRGNDVRGNAGGIELSESTGNRIESNNASGANGSGIALEGNSNGNAIVLNTAGGNSGQGIFVNDAAAGGLSNLIDRNTASSNGGEGIYVNGSGHTVVGNTANFNDGWGIFAAPGTTDGGGNLASGNAEPQQCSGIACIIGSAPGAPDTELVETPADPTNSRNALFTFTGSDDTTPLADLGFECRLDSLSDTAWVECDNPQEYTALSPGEHRFEVRAVDAAGNVDPSPAVHTWRYEALPSGVAPDTSIGLAPPARTPLLEALFTFTANEPDVTFQCSLDGAAFTPCAIAVEYSFEEFEVGTHTFRVRAIDFEGNVDPTPATHTWTITGVVTTFTAGPAFSPGGGPGEPAEGGETESTSATIAFEANVPDATFACSLDLAQFTPCSSPVTYTGLAVGEHSLRVVATDPETGVSEAEPAEYAWTVVSSLDTTPPSTQITTTDPVDQNGALTFAFTGTDNVTSPDGLLFECSLDNPADAAFTACLSPLTLPNPDLPEPVAPGPHVLYVRAIDVEDNIDPTPAELSFTYAGDTVAPQVTITGGPTATTAATQATLAFSADDPFAALECSVDGGPFTECQSPLDVQVEPGEHTVQVRATDLAGNAGDPVARTWSVVGPPETTLTEAPAATTTDTTATFAFTSDQSPATFVCTLDGQPVTPCASPVTLTGLAGGVHEFEVAAVNAFGVADPEPAVHAWTVDAAPPAPPTPPETTLGTTPDASTTDTTATFTFAADVPGSTFECAIDEAAFAPCASPVELTGLGLGEHTFEVRATDPEGEADPTPASFEWDVVAPPSDTTPPATALVLTPPATTADTTATFTFNANEAGSVFECGIDGAPAVACTSPLTLESLAPGDHTVTVTAIDPAGNADPTPASHAWTVEAPADTTAPATSLGATPPATTAETAASFTFSADESGSTFECSLDGAPFAECTSPIELTGLAPGDHTFRVRATDAAGNTDDSPAAHAWTVEAPADTTAPETTVSSGPPASTSETTASIAFGSSEEGSTFECSLDGAAFTPCTSPASFSGLAPGGHTVRVRATDAAGNTDASPAQHTWTVTPPCAPVTLTAAANADAWIQQSTASSNMGQDSVLKVDTKSGANARALVRFALPAAPANCQVTGAQLRLYASSTKPGRTLQALRIGAAWTESTVRWSNQPATAGVASTAVTPSNAAWMQWTATDLVRAMYMNGNNGFLIRDAAENGPGVEQNLHSREKAPDRPPQLVITFGQ